MWRPWWPVQYLYSLCSGWMELNITVEIKWPGPTYLSCGVVSKRTAVVREAPAEKAAQQRRQQEAVSLQNHHLFFQTHNLTDGTSAQLWRQGCILGTISNNVCIWKGSALNTGYSKRASFCLGHMNIFAWSNIRNSSSKHRFEEDVVFTQPSCEFH